MSGNDLEVGIIVTGDDQTGGFSSVQDALGNMQQGMVNSQNAIYTETDALRARGGQIRQTIKDERLFRNGFKQSHALFFTSTRLIGQVGNAAMKTNSIFLNWNVLQERIADTEDRVAAARRRQAAAIERYGAGSKQAMKATEDLNDELKKQEKLGRELPGQYLAMGLGAFSMVGDIANAAQTFGLLRFQIGGKGGLGKVLGLGTSAVKAAEGVSPLSNIAGAGAGLGLSALGGKIKNFAGGPIGKYLLPLIAGVGTYEFLTQDETGKQVNQMVNPFTSLFNGIFALTHSPEQTKQALANQANGGQGGMTVQGDVNFNVKGASSGEVMSQVNSYMKKRSATAGPVG